MKLFPLCLYSLAGLLLCGIISTVQARAPVKEPANKEIYQRLDRIEQLIQSKGLIDMLQQIDRLQQEIDHLRGDIEVQNHTIEQLRKRQRALYTDIDQRLQGMQNASGAAGAVPGNTAATGPALQTLSPEFNAPVAGATTQQADNPLAIETLKSAPAQQQQSVMTPLPAAGTTDNTAAGAATGASVAMDPKQVKVEYQQAFALLKQSRYEQAIKAFRGFLAVNPASDYSDNAQYWLGEAFYVLRQFEQAIAEYTNLVNNYPDSPKVTHALLKIGYSYYELGQIEESRRELQNLRQRYPGTTAARLAEERLKKIAISQQQPAASN
ncbi:MAG: tol-pal system protein YbgF [Gammaproteobacteria bacterium]